MQEKPIPWTSAPACLSVSPPPMIHRDIPQEQAAERLIDARAPQSEAPYDVALRPKTLEEFVGQTDVKRHLSIFLEAAKKRQEPLEHVLLYGNPGLGKTTLAHLIAGSMGGTIRITSGPALEKAGDVAALLSGLKRGDILFIDEIHRLQKTVEEILYPAMEDFALDLVVGKGPGARTLRLNLERFTLIGATTRLSLLSSPLRDRFGMTYQLSFYEEAEMQELLTQSAKRLGVDIEREAVVELAKRCRRTPRVGNRLLRRLRDVAHVRGNPCITQEIAKEGLALLDVDPMGLDRTDRRVLRALIELFQGGPVGLTTLAAATQEDIETLEEVYEPYLLQIGFLERTPRGRVATTRAKAHLHAEINDVSSKT